MAILLLEYVLSALQIRLALETGRATPAPVNRLHLQEPENALFLATLAQLGPIQQPRVLTQQVQCASHALPTWALLQIPSHAH